MTIYFMRKSGHRTQSKEGKGELKERGRTVSFEEFGSIRVVVAHSHLGWGG